MEIEVPKPGKYVVAVSGGVDSVCLLDILNKHPGLEIVVAHFDHGIRPDSAEDRRFVEALAKYYELEFIHQQGNLGPKTSEAKAREARYAFLKQVGKDTSAEAIITAHHQNDLLETAILNMLRGTGRKGLTALQSRTGVYRPLLKVSKQELIGYAQANGLEWHEDPTNADTAYLRNYVRKKILPRFSEANRAKLLDIITNLSATNEELDAILNETLAAAGRGGALDRKWFNQLPHGTAREVIAAWLRNNGLRDFDSRTLERLVVAAKTALPGKQTDVLKGVSMSIEKDRLVLLGLDRKPNPDNKV